MVIARLPDCPPSLFKRIGISRLFPTLRELAVSHVIDMGSPILPLLAVASEMMTCKHHRVLIVRENVLDVLAKRSAGPLHGLVGKVIQSFSAAKCAGDRPMARNVEREILRACLQVAVDIASSKCGVCLGSLLPVRLPTETPLVISRSGLARRILAYRRGRNFGALARAEAVAGRRWVCFGSGVWNGARKIGHEPHPNFIEVFDRAALGDRYGRWRERGG